MSMIFSLLTAIAHGIGWIIVGVFLYMIAACVISLPFLWWSELRGSRRGRDPGPDGM